MERYGLVLDCGATSLRAVAVSERGEILHLSSFPNAPSFQEGEKDFLIWDIDEIWRKLTLAIQQVISQVGKDIFAVTVTTFGADGAPVRKDGTLTYPVISWQCQRTVPQAKEITNFFSPREIFRITGYQIIPFNTLFKLLWLRENAPHSLDEADTFLMMPGILSFKLCGEMSIDFTSASTTMMLDIEKKCWSEPLLSLVNLSPSFFPPLQHPGEVIGKVQGKASEETGIPPGTPVVAAGHDTQFAIVGSLASPQELVLSSGTWEIAALRLPYYRDSSTFFEQGGLTELDAEENLWNPQMLMIAGGVVEWVRRNFFSDIKDEKNIYEVMIESARSVSPGAGGVVVIPAFMPSGPTKPYATQGTILGLELTSDRGQVFRAALEGLSFQLKEAVLALQEAFDYTPPGVRVVGGGAKNKLWNQIRADVLNLPVVTTSCAEATVLGASLFSQVGAGIVKNLEEAKNRVKVETTVWEPSPQKEIYEELFAQYAELPPLLAPFYRERGLI
ncbi:MAG TPA: FGGY family carbohydrate kinase [Candidatus Atribacteria bacterium]|nr:FGGY family carbohydrate kinase [Candidatus Atribacteria bacterium]